MKNKDLPDPTEFTQQRFQEELIKNASIVSGLVRIASHYGIWSNICKGFLEKVGCVTIEEAEQRRIELDKRPYPKNKLAFTEVRFVQTDELYSIPYEWEAHNHGLTDDVTHP